MVLGLLPCLWIWIMNTARIENVIGLANLSWRKTFILCALGVLVGLALVVANRLPVF